MLWWLSKMKVIYSCVAVTNTKYLENFFALESYRNCTQGVSQTVSDAWFYEIQNIHKRPCFVCWLLHIVLFTNLGIPCHFLLLTGLVFCFEYDILFKKLFIVNNNVYKMADCSDISFKFICRLYLASKLYTLHSVPIRKNRKYFIN